MIAELSRLRLEYELELASTTGFILAPTRRTNMFGEDWRAAQHQITTRFM